LKSRNKPSFPLSASSTTLLFAALRVRTADSENAEHKLHAIRNVQARKHSAEISANGGFADSEDMSDLLVAFSSKNQLNDFRLLRRETQRADDVLPFIGIEWKCGGSSLTAHLAPKKESVEPRTLKRTPAKGRTERALADAPIGARAQSTAPVHQTWRFFV
jgi:hypothetical protein